MPRTKKIKEVHIKKNEMEIPQCPHCKISIINYASIFYNRKYQCTECKGKYYLIKLSDYLYTHF